MRLISRTTCDFFITLAADGVRNHGNLRRAVLLRAIMIANVEHITRAAVRSWRHAGQDQNPADTEPRPVSILSLSQSMQTPFETTRQHVIALEREGFCCKTPAGVVVPPEVLKSERMIESEAVRWEAFWGMISAFRALDFDFSMILGDAVSRDQRTDMENFCESPSLMMRRSTIASVISEFQVNCAVYANAPQDHDWMDGHVYTAIIALNNAVWSLDKGKAWRYSRADTPPPENLRKPASIADAARLTGHGKELVRRKIHDLEKAGRIERRNSGFVATINHLLGPENTTATLVIVKAFYRMIYDLTALGVRL